MSPSLTLFTDRDLGQQFPDIVIAAGLTVIRYSDLFAPDAPDEEWLEGAGAEGWIAVTHDKRTGTSQTSWRRWADQYRQRLLFALTKYFL